MIAGIIGTIVAACWAWSFSRPFREWLRRSRIARLACQARAACASAATRIMAAATKLLELFILNPWRAITARATAIGRRLREVRWGAHATTIFICAAPFLMFGMLETMADVPLESYLGVMAAGALIGALCAPYAGWRCRSQGIVNIARAVGLTIMGGAYASSMLVCMLVMLALDS